MDNQRFPRLGIQEIDDQHSRLFNTIDKLKSYIGTAHETAVVFDTMMALTRYIAEHFSYEENLLHELNYPRLDEHIGMHREITKKFQLIYDNALNGEEVSGELIALLNSWLLEHIGKEDKRYAEVLTKNQ